LLRRSPAIFCVLEERELVDVAAFLNGELRLTAGTELALLSAVTGERYPCTAGDLERLARVPADRWTAEDRLAGELGAEPSWLAEQVRRGLLLSDADDATAAHLRRRAELLAAQQWHPRAALYHFLIRGPDAAPASPPDDDAEALEHAAAGAAAFLARFGPPPEPFHRRGERPDVVLPLVEPAGEFWDTLRTRRTVRAFDPDGRLPLADFSALLRAAFGCQGLAELAPGVSVLHRTSPSGGARHPIEVYPLVLRVEGVASGLYHYDGHDHGLVGIRELQPEAAAAWVREAARGQRFVGSAHAVFVLTARFFRHHWKYRRRDRAYAVILMDAGHLGQTFQLAATELGLGAFFTAAIDGPRIEQGLGIDGFEEGALALCGCGVRRRDGTAGGLEYRPFTPPRPAAGPKHRGAGGLRRRDRPLPTD